jgi:hypothetical protein
MYVSPLSSSALDVVQYLSCAAQLTRDLTLTMLDYKHIENLEGECEMLAKKALISRLRGDYELADDWAARYVNTKRKYKTED